MKINSSTAWACASGKVLMPWTVSATRSEVIKKMVKNFGFNGRKSWDQLKREGNAVVKILMVPQIPKRNG